MPEHTGRDRALPSGRIMAADLHTIRQLEGVIDGVETACADPPRIGAILRRWAMLCGERAAGIRTGAD
ncbi:hypothetical protein [Roseinatronobacter alkalisoli]|uniref:Uncharacterized protein n=1 Tax=Roseinatronobacter alkalisoli TaxID=3028235 RepID=A0ABT5TF26_9RHOB|nr:hypothetical protein [Roseinatronobacter sp. HJB301]MDD7973310.1 hypothetical protein [Roseinatronobacter sp. HJB301]